PPWEKYATPCSRSRTRAPRYPRFALRARLPPAPRARARVPVGGDRTHERRSRVRRRRAAFAGASALRARRAARSRRGARAIPRAGAGRSRRAEPARQAQAHARRPVAGGLLLGADLRAILPPRDGAHAAQG